MDFKKIFENAPGGKILDVGTGVGNFIPILQECFNDYTEILGIDCREAGLARARDNFKVGNVKFLLMDAAKMEFDDNSFDTVAISNTLHHLPDIKSVLEEMKRVLKPGGIFVISEMFCDDQTEKQMSHVKIHHLQGEMDTLLGICHNKTFKRQEIINIAKGLELKITGTYEYNTHNEQLEEADYKEEKSTLDNIFVAMENELERLRGFKQYSELKNRLDELKNTLYDIGIFGATNLFVIGEK